MNSKPDAQRLVENNTTLSNNNRFVATELLITNQEQRQQQLQDIYRRYQEWFNECRRQRREELMKARTELRQTFRPRNLF